MGIEGIIVLLLVAAVLVLLVLEKVGIDAIGIGLIVVLVLLGYVIKIFDPAFVPEERLLGVDDALHLFGNSAVVMVA
ncbi:MAG: hypothetical protein OTI37_05455, partial [Planctomycetota bacterium]|nr:hypothetical protein [Planctomycetota bacterium]